MSDSAEPYIYPGSNVLRNKEGIRDAAALHKFEHEKTSFRAIEFRKHPIVGNFDLGHISAIHKQLFQDVYEWAGKVRSVFIAKGDSMFAHPEFIESAWKAEHKKLAERNYLRGMEKDNFTAQLALHYSEINAIHPFREGNGRSTREYLRQLAQEADYKLEFSKVSKTLWNEAAIQSFNSKPDSMQKVFSVIATHNKAIAFDLDKPSDAITKHPSLKSAFLTLKAAEIYAEQVIPDRANRDNFLLKTRSQIRDTLAEGKDIPIPHYKDVTRGLER